MAVTSQGDDFEGDGKIILSKIILTPNTDNEDCLLLAASASKGKMALEGAEG